MTVAILYDRVLSRKSLEMNGTGLKGVMCLAKAGRSTICTY